jgi:hypothetical protein
MWMTPIGELHRYGLLPSKLKCSCQFRTIRLLSPMSLFFQIREYRPGVRNVILMYGKKKAFFPYVIFIRNRMTGSFHVCFAEERIRSRFSKVYLPDELISNIFTTTRVCLGSRHTKKGNYSLRFSLKGAIERFWWSPFDRVQFHPSSLEKTINSMRNRSSTLSLRQFVWICLFGCV